MTRHTAVLATTFVLLGAATAHAEPEPSDDPARTPRTPAAQQAAAETTSPAEVELTFAERKVVQERLRDKGHYQGSVDGLFGKATQAAVRKFQEANQLTRTGELDAPTLAALGIEITATQPTQTAATAPSQPADKPTATTTESMATAGEMRLGNERTLTLSAMEPAALRAIQRRLQTLGFYEGPIDGVAGPATREALTAYYQEQIELVSGGKLLAEGALAFNLNAADIEPVRGEDKPATKGPRQGERPRHGEKGHQHADGDERD
jgi:peptidoglycan hydrolase-like protein with peptidoglycan-binding domain